MGYTFLNLVCIQELAALLRLCKTSSVYEQKVEDQGYVKERLVLF